MDYTKLPIGSGLPWMIELGRSKDELLFHSERARATIPTLMMSPGYGPIPIGTVMAENKSAAGNSGQLFPYAPADFSDVATNMWARLGRMFLIEDGEATTNTIKVSLPDSYKPVIGDELIIDDDTTPPEDLGAITDITRGMAYATITVTNDIGSTAFTVARLAHVRVKAGETTPWSDAYGITTLETDGGSGEFITEAIPTSIVLRGADLYTNKGALGNLDPAAVSKLNGRIVNNLFLF